MASDLISREEAISLFFDSDDIEYTGAEVCSMLRTFLSARKGRWIIVGDNQPISCDVVYTCSNCHNGRYISITNINYCPYCGAKMKVNE